MKEKYLQYQLIVLASVELAKEMGYLIGFKCDKGAT